MKQCTKCKKLKSLADFYKNKQAKDGCDSACKKCQRPHEQKYRKTHKTEIAKRDKKYYYSLKGKERTKRKILKKYGLTLDEHQLMYILQNGKCAICKELIAYDEVKTDHCHKSGKVRGLLCNRCNIRLSTVEDGNFLLNALKYLEKHRGSA